MPKRTHHPAVRAMLAHNPGSAAEERFPRTEPPHNGNACVTIVKMHEIEIQEFLDSSGRSPFGRWFDGLNAVAAARVAVGMTRPSQANFSNVEGVGAGVYELKLDFGPGIASTSARTASES